MGRIVGSRAVRVASAVVLAVLVLAHVWFLWRDHTATGEVASLTTELSSTEVEAATARDELAGAQAQLAEAEAALADAIAARDGAAATAQTVGGELRSVDDARARAERSLAALSAQVAEIESEAHLNHELIVALRSCLDGGIRAVNALSVGDVSTARTATADVAVACAQVERARS